MGKYSTKTKAIGKIFLSLFLFALLIGSTVAGYYYYKVIIFTRNINPNNEITMDLPIWSGKDRVNILLLGTDFLPEGEKASRSDSQIIVSIDPQTKKITMMSILRDTYVKIPGHRKQKINAANALGGPELAIETISKFTDIPIHYYVQTDFNGFKTVVDSVGGIDVDIKKEIIDKPFKVHFKPGILHMNGVNALKYVRVRKGINGGNDYARTQRQREVISLVVQKVKSVYGIYKLPGLLENVQPYIRTNMAFNDMIKLRSFLTDFNRENMQSVQIPAEGTFESKMIEGVGSSLVPDVYKNRKMIRELLGMPISEEMANNSSAYTAELYQDMKIQKKNKKSEETLPTKGEDKTDKVTEPEDDVIEPEEPDNGPVEVPTEEPPIDVPNTDPNPNPNPNPSPNPDPNNQSPSSGTQTNPITSQTNGNGSVSP
jgi:polyisoprenyl-teichoic acid--peptidoglycan teichoic acid transferase